MNASNINYFVKVDDFFTVIKAVKNGSTIKETCFKYEEMGAICARGGDYKKECKANLIANLPIMHYAFSVEQKYGEWVLVSRETVVSIMSILNA